MRRGRADGIFHDVVKTIMPGLAARKAPLVDKSPHSLRKARQNPL